VFVAGVVLGACLLPPACGVVLADSRALRLLLHELGPIFNRELTAQAPRLQPARQACAGAGRRCRGESAWQQGQDGRRTAEKAKEEAWRTHARAALLVKRLLPSLNGSTH